jgi:hypothetical protein
MFTPRLGTHSFTHSRYVLVVQRPYDMIVDAIERRDADAVGATGVFAQKITEGAATVHDYMSFKHNETTLNPLTTLLSAADRKLIGKGVSTRNDHRIAITRMLGLEATVVLADRPAESLLLLSQTLGVDVASHVSSCVLRKHGGDPQRTSRPDVDQATVRAVNQLHAFDYRLYNAARRLFRRQWHHAFGRAIDLREDHPLDCYDRDQKVESSPMECFGSNNVSSLSAPHLPERLAKRVAEGVELVCTQRCTIQLGLGQ